MTTKQLGLKANREGAERDVRVLLDHYIKRPGHTDLSHLIEALIEYHYAYNASIADDN